MGRISYFQNIAAVPSPLLFLADGLNKIIEARIKNLPEPIDLYLDFASKLLAFDTESANTRSAFITMQCGKQDSTSFFEQHRESWGIPKFEEDLVTDGDFKFGFLDTFRDHSTTWCEDGEARDWFFSHVEARFVRHYQFWACDNGPDEILLRSDGNYKNIMWTIVKDYQDYSALASPIFTKQELQTFYDNFDEAKRDYYKSDLLEMIEENPNW